MFLGPKNWDNDPFAEFSTNQGAAFDTVMAWNGNFSDLVLQRDSMWQSPNEKTFNAKNDGSTFNGASQNNEQARNTSQTGNSQNANATESNNQANAALNKAAQVKSQLKSASAAPSPEKTAKTGGEKQAAAGGKQQAEQSRKDVASAKEEVKESAGMEAGGAPSAFSTAMGSVVAHGGMVALGVPGIASGLMTAHDTYRAMQSNGAPPSDDNTDDAEASLAELEQAESELASIEDDFDTTIDKLEEREEQGIDVSGVEAGTPIAYDDIALTSMTLNEGTGIVFTGGNTPVHATNDLLANVRDADGSRESGRGEATSAFEMNEQQIYQMSGLDGMALA